MKLGFLGSILNLSLMTLTIQRVNNLISRYALDVILVVGIKEQSLLKKCIPPLITCAHGAMSGGGDPAEIVPWLGVGGGERVQSEGG